MFDQYLELGGTEIANAARVKAYVEKNASHLPLRAPDELDTLHLALGEDEYESPIVDDAPWLDPSNPATAKFFGVYPLAVQGVDDSTLQATSRESIGPGGTTSAQRAASRAIRVRAMLVAETDLGMDAGMTWLKSALRASECTDHGGSCGGAKLCYYAARPEVCDEWDSTFQAGYSRPISATVANSPQIIRDPADDSMYIADLDSPYYPASSSKEGVIIQWGTVSRANTSVVVESYGPIVRQRTNRLLNPYFATGVANWTATASAVMTWESGAGPEGYSSMLMTGPATGKVQSAPVYPISGESVASFEVRSDAETAPLTVRMLDSVGGVLATGTFVVDDLWKTYSFVYSGSQTVYRIEFEGTGVHIARTVLESGLIPLPPFSGGVPWQEAMQGYIVGGMEDEYTVSWLGTPNASASRVVWNGRLTVGKEFGAESGEGACDTWPYISIMQGRLSGGSADFALRLKIPTWLQVLPFERTLHDVTAIEGPIKIQDLPLESGAMRVVEFTLVANKPSPYSTTQTLIHPTVMSSLPWTPWPGVEACDIAEPTPIIDPDCVVPPDPPRPPEIAASCVMDEPILSRYWLSVPAENVSLWSDMVPKVIIQSGQQAVRQVRVRAFPNPFEREVETVSRRNYTRNVSAEVNLTDFVGFVGGSGGAFSLTRVTGTPPTGASAYVRTTVTTAPTSGTRYVDVRNAGVGATRVWPGNRYTFSTTMRGNFDGDDITYLQWLDAAGAVIATETGATTAAVTADGWKRRHLVTSAVAPENAVWATTIARRIPASGTLAIGNYVDATMFMTEPGTQLREFFSGRSTPADGWYYAWRGNPDASESLAYRSPVDPCSWCSEFIVSYLPPQTELTVDAILERAFASVAGGEPQPADTLMYATDGGPMTWPALTCGTSYLFAIDVPETLLPDVTVSVELARRE